MGEAKRKEEAAKAGVKTQMKIYAEGDMCPACGKTLAAMDKENGGKLLSISGAMFVCLRCGNMFVPRSRIKFMMQAADRKIVDPNSPEGQAVQKAASKIVLP